MSSSNHLVDTTGTLTSNGFTLTGWTFTGWNTDPYGNGTPYADNSSIIIATDDSVVTLYAQWKQNSYTIIYDKNKPVSPVKASHEVEGSMNNSSHIYDTASFLRSNTYTLEGWHFAGWKTEDGTSYINGAEVTTLSPNDSIRLYAQWEENTFTIVYVSNGGTGTMNDTIVTYDTSANIRKNTFKNTGRNFDKWTAVVNGVQRTFGEEANVTNLTSQNGATIIFTAQWKSNEYYVHYNSNRPNTNREIKGQMLDSKHKVYETSSLNANTFSFTGWNTKADGSGTSYANSAEVMNLTYDNNVTVELYAQWEASTYTILYNANLPMANVTRTDQLPSSTTHTYDTTSNISHFYTLVSWEMTGWLYNGRTYDSSQEVINLTDNGGSITFIAQWQAKKNVNNCQNSRGIYEIVSVDQLKGISDNSYKLMCDLEIDGNWIAISEFTGTLDLNSYTIAYHHDYLGTNFNYGIILNNRGTITNGYFKPFIVQSFVHSSQENEVYIGGVVAENYGIIENVEVRSYLGIGNDFMTSGETKTDINAISFNCIIGGIAGVNFGTIHTCKNYASLGGSYYIGGIVGRNRTNGKVEDCTNEGRIWYCSIGGDYRCVGGVVAANYQYAVIADCKNTEIIIFAYKTDSKTNDEMYIANIAGWSYSSATVDNCKGINDPIDVRVDELTSTQSKYIKTNGENIGRYNNGPEPDHNHKYEGDYVPYSFSYHQQFCECGASSKISHKFINVSTGRQCVHCGYLVQLNVGLGMDLSGDSLSHICCIEPKSFILKYTTNAPGEEDLES